MLPFRLILGLAFILTWMGSVRADDEFFRKRVAPIFERHCVHCHQGKEPKGGLDLTAEKSFRSGGDAGEVVVPRKPDESRLIDTVSGDKPEMPKDGSPLSAEQVADLRRWVTDGAVWPDGVILKERREEWWSLLPIVRPPVPSLHQDDLSRVRTPVDAFILSALRQKGLAPSPEADRRTLIRRLTFDLHGLPPTPDEIATFVNDSRPDTYERLVDRLLDSPRYGERWARHWLDVVHYGETHGYDKDKRRPDSWPYRDYVIRSFNDDKPYDRFVAEQLAGDVLEPGAADGIIATGFIAAGPWDFVGHAELREGTVDKNITRSLDRDDMVMNTMSTFTSLTVHCARCHDHKFDPIQQADYYNLQAVFAGVERASRPFDLDPATTHRRDELNAQRQTLEVREKSLKEAKPVDEAALKELQTQLDDIRKQLAALPPVQTVYAAAANFSPNGSFTPAPNGKPRPIHILNRGSVTSPGDLAMPGAVQCVKALPSNFELSNPDNEGSRRAALARWITDSRNPLTWRSIVNRVWHYHFGRGLVDSPNDFGRMGSKPTHPEFLDWLAADFRDGDRSLKRLHRMMVTSAAYRQQSASIDAMAKLDGDNRYLWRMNRRRLESEAIRDALLEVTGTSRSTMYGPGFDLFAFIDDHSPHYHYDQHDVDDPRALRRTVYRFIVRSVPDPFMDCLDCADPSQIVPARNTTITALQALALLNNKFVVRQAEHFATRLRHRNEDLSKQIDDAFQLALGRNPTDDERSALIEYTKKHGLEKLARLVFNMNEFVFVD
ncbi:MAG: DUF1553 domain-containing protein [Planctomycetaceae bacterium]